MSTPAIKPLFIRMNEADNVAIIGVISPGDKLTQKGLAYTSTPASDFICGAGQLAGAMNLHVFTTGRGTPHGLAQVPVIKAAIRGDLARRSRRQYCRRDLGVFSSHARSCQWPQKNWAERWKLHNPLVLLNPAPVT